MSEKICSRYLGRSDTTGSTLAKISLDQNIKLSKDEEELLTDPSLHSRLIGRLLYLIITKPDLAYSVQLLSHHMNNPRIPHLHQKSMDTASNPRIALSPTVKSIIDNPRIA